MKKKKQTEKKEKRATQNDKFQKTIRSWTTRQNLKIGSEKTQKTVKSARKLQKLNYI